MTQVNTEYQGSYTTNNTECIRMYNTGIVAMTLSYYRNNKTNSDGGLIKLSPAYAEEVDGKVYNYDKEVSTLFGINYSDAYKLIHVLETMEADATVTNGLIKHYGGDAKSALLVTNLDNGIELRIIIMDNSFNTINELAYTFNSEPTEDRLELNVDSATLSNGTSVELNSELAIFKEWLQSVVNVSIKSGQHLPYTNKLIETRGSGSTGSGSTSPRSVVQPASRGGVANNPRPVGAARSVRGTPQPVRKPEVLDMNDPSSLFSMDDE